MDSTQDIVMERVEREIAPKGKGYVVFRRCPAAELPAALDREAAALFALSAEHVYAASTDPDTPLGEGNVGPWSLAYVHDMLAMYGELGPDRPRPEGRLTLEPLTRESGAEWLSIYNESFHSVPNSATYGEKELEQILGPEYRCGFALEQGKRVGVFELGYKKEFPEIGSIGLSANARGNGLGRELLLSVMDLIAGQGYAKCWLQVSTANAAAYALYQSVGFTLDRVLSQWFEVKRAGGFCPERHMTEKEKE